MSLVIFEKVAQCPNLLGYIVNTWILLRPYQASQATKDAMWVLTALLPYFQPQADAVTLFLLHISFDLGQNLSGGQNSSIRICDSILQNSCAPRRAHQSKRPSLHRSACRRLEAAFVSDRAPRRNQPRTFTRLIRTSY